MFSRMPRARLASGLLKRRYATKPPPRTTTSISTTTTPSSFWGQTFKKVRAYPFTVEPRDAQASVDTVKFLAEHIWLADTINFFSALFGKPVRPLGRIIHRYVKYKYRNEPIYVEAVYVPMWRVYAFVGFMALDNKTKLTGHKSITIADGYLPGIDTPSYSSKAHFNLPTIAAVETKPIGDCIKPFGLTAQCLPFTISPFSPFELAKTVGNKAIPLSGEDMAVYPATAYPDFYAAFPVMVPVYTGRVEAENMSTSVVVQAFGAEPLIVNRANLVRDKREFDDPDGEIKVIWQRTARNHAKKLAAMTPLKTDDDACIRPLIPEEVDPVLRLLQVRRNLYDWNRLDAKTLPENRRKAYYRELEFRKERFLEYIPSWWSESKLAPPEAKKPGKQSNKPRPTKSRSSPI